MQLRPLVSLQCLLVVALVLAGCGSKPAGGAAGSGGGSGEEEKVLNIYNWVDYIGPTIISDFEKQTGIKVNYDTFDSNELLETKLLSGTTGYDVVVPSASFLERQIKAGVFQKLDKSQLPNLKNMDPAISAIIARHDPGNEHAVNYFWGTSGIGYNVEKVKAAMPNAPVDSFAMFYDPNVIRNFKDCGVTVLDAPDEVIATVLLYLGLPPMSEKPEDLAAAEKVLMSIRPYIREIKSAGYIEDLANGEICLALGWSGDVGQAATRAAEAHKPYTIRYNLPKEGAIMFFDMLAIPADAQHVKNAHRFINYLMSTEVAVKNTNALRYTTSNASAIPLLDKSLTDNKNYYPTADAIRKMSPNLARSQEFTRLLNRTWTRFKTGK
ncbi:MAG TPA: polyamine ABC transporter substrate-binding protein [Steroidobacteraceae bacterium]|nr:polyamine ABC transporter substrate-binding protein [Steroidobacteraceae bacterium]